MLYFTVFRCSFYEIYKGKKRDIYFDDSKKVITHAKAVLLPLFSFIPSLNLNMI